MYFISAHPIAVAIMPQQNKNVTQQFSQRHRESIFIINLMIISGPLRLCASARQNYFWVI